MFTKKYPIFLLTLSLCLAGALSTLGQLQPVRGMVKVRKADGTEVPVADATIEAYRTDIDKGTMPATKTNKRGEFSFVGFAAGHVYALSVSGPGIGPRVKPNVKAGQEDVLIIVSEGDGAKLSEAEVRQVGAAAVGVPDAAVTEAQRKQREEIEKKNEEIKKKNSKIQEGDEVARTANTAGIAAIQAKNWDVAIAEFDKGVAAVPDFVGSTPILLNGKLVAYKSRGYDKYREGAANADGTARKAKYDEANKDYDAGLAAFDQAMAIIKAAEAPANPQEQKGRESLTLSLLSNAMEVHRLKAVSGVDTSKVAKAGEVIEAYIAAQPDAAKKLEGRKTLGDIYRLTGDLDKAVAAYKVVLEASPDNTEVMASLGLSMYALAAGAEPPNREQMQEGLNYMAKYSDTVQILPTDPPAVQEFKKSVKATVEYLKTEEKLKPQTTKSTPAKKKT